MIDLNAICKALTDICETYEKTAPTVCEWANDLYIRINEDTKTVTLCELMMVPRFCEEGTWMGPNYAANSVYHLMQRLGRNTVGHAGF